MIYFERERNYKKIKEIAIEESIDKQKLYESVRDMENYHLLKFKKTPFGSYLVEDSQIDYLKEYSLLKSVSLSPRQAAEIIREKIQKEISENNNEDMEWAKGLNFAVWRNF